MKENKSPITCKPDWNRRCLLIVTLMVYTQSRIFFPICLIKSKSLRTPAYLHASTEAVALLASFYSSPEFQIFKSNFKSTKSDSNIEDEPRLNASYNDMTLETLPQMHLVKFSPMNHLKIDQTPAVPTVVSATIRYRHLIGAVLLLKLYSHSGLF